MDLNLQVPKWGYDVYDNEPASDLGDNVISHIVKTYFTEDLQLKRSLKVEEIVALGDVCVRLNNMGTSGLPTSYYDTLYDRIVDLHTPDYYKLWRYPGKRKKVIKRLLGKIRKICGYS